MAVGVRRQRSTGELLCAGWWGWESGRGMGRGAVASTGHPRSVIAGKRSAQRAHIVQEEGLSWRGNWTGSSAWLNNLKKMIRQEDGVIIHIFKSRARNVQMGL